MRADVGSSCNHPVRWVRAVGAVRVAALRDPADTCKRVANTTRIVGMVVFIGFSFVEPAPSGRNSK
jgi:hypothetical protein